MMRRGETSVVALVLLLFAAVDSLPARRSQRQDRCFAATRCRFGLRLTLHLLAPGLAPLNHSRNAAFKGLDVSRGTVCLPFSHFGGPLCDRCTLFCSSQLSLFGQPEFILLAAEK